jgi:hypothetical protein
VPLDPTLDTLEPVTVTATPLPPPTVPYIPGTDFPGTPTPAPNPFAPRECGPNQYVIRDAQGNVLGCLDNFTPPAIPNVPTLPTSAMIPIGVAIDAGAIARFAKKVVQWLTPKVKAKLSQLKAEALDKVKQTADELKGLGKEGKTVAQALKEELNAKKLAARLEELAAQARDASGKVDLQKLQQLVKAETVTKLAPYVERARELASAARALGSAAAPALAIAGVSYLVDQMGKPVRTLTGDQRIGKLDFFTPTVQKVTNARGSSSAGQAFLPGNVGGTPSLLGDLREFTPTSRYILGRDSSSPRLGRAAPGADTLGLGLQDVGSLAPGIGDAFKPSITLGEGIASRVKGWLGALDSASTGLQGLMAQFHSGGLTASASAGVSSSIGPIASVVPQFLGNPLNVVDPIAGTVARRQPIPPKSKTKTCECQAKPKKKKQPRNKCYRGTYLELANGLKKSRKEEIPCQ